MARPSSRSRLTVGDSGGGVCANSAPLKEEDDEDILMPPCVFRVFGGGGRDGDRRGEAPPFDRFGLLLRL